MLQTHGKLEAGHVKRFSIDIHVSLAIPRETSRDKATYKAKLIVMSLSCVHSLLYIASGFMLTVCLRLKTDHDSIKKMIEIVRTRTTQHKSCPAPIP